MNKVGLIVGGVVIIVILLGLYLSGAFSNIFGGAKISGTFDLNGPIPDGATVTLLVREKGVGDFSPVISKVPAKDAASWQWTGAVSDKSYDIEAQLVQNGSVLMDSPVSTVTAPASGVVLTINYTTVADETTDQSSPVSAQSTQTGNATISGQVKVNGYIPSGARVSVEGRRMGSGNLAWTTVVDHQSATQSLNVTYATAITGASYLVRGVLFDSNDNVIGTSSVLELTAPASNEVLVINSTAPAPPPPPSGGNNPAPQPTSSIIQGTITLNGSAPQGGSFVVLERTPPGSGNFNVALDGINPTSGTQFSWNGANAGTAYEMVVSLKNSSKNDVATSNSVIVTAPASGVNFTINSNLSLAPPSQPVTLSCGNKNSSNNTWSATVNYPSVSGAQAYWLQLGTTNGGNNLVNVTQLAQAGNFQTAGITLNDSVTYYARYAYSYSPNPTTSNYYSSFSGSYSFKCPQ